MWPFRRRPRAQPSGTLRLGEHGVEPADYAVFTVGESRFPETFRALLAAADADERANGTVRRWATLVPIHDPAFGVADLAVEIDGMRAGYLRPPHLGRLAARIDTENVAALEVPALVVWGPAGPTVTLRIDDPA
jgi:hypothetical protein